MKNDSTITFHSDSNNWVMKIHREEDAVKILFNREDYPNALPDDFAEAVAKILCRSGYLDRFYKDKEAK